MNVPLFAPSKTFLIEWEIKSSPYCTSSNILYNIYQNMMAYIHSYRAANLSTFSFGFEQIKSSLYCSNSNVLYNIYPNMPVLLSRGVRSGDQLIDLPEHSIPFEMLPLKLNFTVQLFLC